MSDEAYAIFITVCLVLAVLFTLIGKVVAAEGKKKEEAEKNKQHAVDDVYGINDEGPITVEADTTVLAKSTEHHSGIDRPVHQIVFQTSAGQRLCFAIKEDAIYQIVLEGDVGELRFVQKRFESFTPKTR